MEIFKKKDGRETKKKNKRTEALLFRALLKGMANSSESIRIEA